MNITEDLRPVLDQLASHWYAYHAGATVEVGGRIYPHPTLEWAADGRPQFGAYRWSVSFETDHDPGLPSEPTTVTYRCGDHVLTGQCRPSISPGGGHQYEVNLYGVDQLEIER